MPTVEPDHAEARVLTKGQLAVAYGLGGLIGAAAAMAVIMAALYL